MLTRILTKGLLASGLQVLFYFVALYVFWYSTVAFFRPDNREISDLAVGTSIPLFAIIVTVQNLASSIINRKWVTIILFVLTVTIYLIGWGEDINSFPFSATIFILVGLLSLTLKFYIDKKIDNYADRKHTA
ncbi:MAG: hypothetical protein HS119_00005, partial [Flavobacteriales bacterium]|nr:hypothetical protein [Flavobacteriales bacterium]